VSWAPSGFRGKATVSRARKTELMCRSLRFAGDLLLAIMSSSQEFNDLSDDERKFVEEYIESVGHRLVAQADARDPKNKTAAKAVLRTLTARGGK